MSNQAFVQILIVSCHRPELLSRCLKSVCENFSGLHISCTVRVYLNGPDPKSREVMRSVQNQCPSLNWDFIYSGVTAPRGRSRNILLERSEPGWVLFLDDDAYLPTSYAEELKLLNLQEQKVHIVGGPNLSPPGEGPLAAACDLVFSDPLAAGPFSKRYRKGPTQRTQSDAAFVLCHLWLFYDGRFRFADRLSAGEENVLFNSLVEDGAKALYVGSLFVYHERRNTFSGLIEQFYRYGTGRANAIHAKYGRGIHVLGIFILIVPFVLFWILASLPGLCVLYLGYVLVMSLRFFARSGDRRAAARAPGLLVLLQTLYPLGLLVGLLFPSLEGPTRTKN